MGEYIPFCRYYSSIKAIPLLLSASFPCPLSLFILSAPILVTDKHRQYFSGLSPPFPIHFQASFPRLPSVLDLNSFPLLFFLQESLLLELKLE